MTKCMGCGALLQNENKSKEGYTQDLNNKLCERCFRITHYNEYIKSTKTNEEYLKKIEKINKTKDLVVLAVDFLNIVDLDSLNIKNDILLVFTKKDLLPRSVIESKFLSRIDSTLNIVDKIFISSKNNYNLDLLYSKIMKYKKTNNVYVIGYTNAGKSTLINKMTKNYKREEGLITTSNLPSTTLDFIETKINDDLFLIDTPGLLDEGSIIEIVTKEELKKITPKKEINPIIYQIKNKQTIWIEDFMGLTLDKNNIIIYMSNNLNINRVYKEKEDKNDLNKYEIIINENEDLVIKGLGFIKFKKGCTLELKLRKDVKYFTRKSIV